MGRMMHKYAAMACMLFAAFAISRPGHTQQAGMVNPGSALPQTYLLILSTGLLNCMNIVSYLPDGGMIMDFTRAATLYPGWTTYKGIKIVFVQGEYSFVSPKDGEKVVLRKTEKGWMWSQYHNGTTVTAHFQFARGEEERRRCADASAHPVLMSISTPARLQPLLGRYCASAGRQREITNKHICLNVQGIAADGTMQGMWEETYNYFGQGHSIEEFRSTPCQVQSGVAGEQCLANRRHPDVRYVFWWDAAGKMNSVFFYGQDNYIQRDTAWEKQPGSKTSQH